MSLLTTSDRPLPYTGVCPPPPNPVFPPGPFSSDSSVHWSQSTTVPIPRRPHSQIPQISEFFPICHPQIPHISPFLLGQALPPHDPSSLGAPPPNTHTPNSFLGPSHTRIVSPSHHPLPGSGLVRGPREAGARWGPQWGGRAASMAAVAAVRRQPPVPGQRAPASPTAGRASGTGGRWVTTAAAAGGGGKRRGQGRGSTRGTQGRERQVDGGGAG